MPKLVASEMFWAGNEQSLIAAQTAEQRVAALVDAGGIQEKDDTTADMLSVEGRTGVITIKGPLVNSDSWVYAYLGIPTYSRIRAALLEAAMNGNVDQIMLDIDSGGGAVAGVSDTADLIALVDQNIKPVYAYTDGAMASGAYWLGCSAREIFAAKTAEVGSIGVITSRLEYSKQLEKEGITAHVIRSGKFKQAGNPLEPLSDENLAEIQSRIDGLAAIFDQHVATQRGKSAEYTRTVMGQGRVFLAQNALEIGLVDKITNFDAAFAAVSAKQVDIRRISNENNGIGAIMSNNKNKTPLTEAVQAALIAAGHISAGPEEPTIAVEVVEATDAGAVSATEAVAATVAEAATGNPEAAKLQEDVDALTAQLVASQEQLASATTENTSLVAKLAAEQVSVAAFSGIAVKSINAMQIALGGRASDFEGAAASDVLATHTRVSTDFKKNFKAGGVAAVTPSTGSESKKVVNDSLRTAQLNAARL